MDDQQINTLVAQHARLAAQYAAGDMTTLEKLRQIEESLGMTAEEIRERFTEQYLKSY